MVESISLRRNPGAMDIYKLATYHKNGQIRFQYDLEIQFTNGDSLVRSDIAPIFRLLAVKGFQQAFSVVDIGNYWLGQLYYLTGVTFLNRRSF